MGTLGLLLEGIRPNLHLSSHLYKCSLPSFPGDSMVSTRQCRTQVPSLIWEDPTFLRAAKSVCHDYWACAPQPASHSHWSPHTLKPVLLSKRSHHHEKPTHGNCSPYSPQLEKAHTERCRLGTAINIHVRLVSKKILTVNLAKEYLGSPGISINPKPILWLPWELSW